MNNEVNEVNDPIETAALPTQKKKHKKLILLGIVCALILALAITAAIVFSRPKTIVYLSVGGAVDDMLEREEIEPLVETLNGGSVALSVQTGTGVASGKVYFDLENLQLYAEDVTLYQDETEYTATGKVGFDGIWVKSNGNLLGGTYGLMPGSVLDQLEKSNIEDSMGKSDYYRLEAICAAYDDEELEEIFADIKKVSERCAKEKLDLMLEYGELTVEKRERKIGSERMKVRVLTLVLDARALEDVDRAYIDFLESDRNVKKLLTTYEAFFIGLMGKNPDKSNVMELFEDAMAEQRDGIDYYDDLEYTYQLVIKAHSTRALAFSMDVSYGDDYEYTRFSIEGTEKGLKRSDKLTINYYGEEIVYEVIENTKKDFHAKVTIDEDTVATFKLDKERETYTFAVEDHDYKFISASGDLVITDKKTTLTLYDLIVEGEELSLSGKVTFVKEDKMPDDVASGTSVKNPFSLDEERLEEAIEPFVYSWYDFVNSMFD